MTYEQALDWLEKNVPLGNYDNFSDWYEACQDKLSTPNLFGSAEFNRMLEQAWLNEFGSFNREEIDTTPSQADSEQRRIDITEKERQRITRPTIITPNQTPIRIESKSPIFITRISVPEDRIVLPPTGRAPKITPMKLVFPRETRIEKIRQVINAINIFSRFRRKKN